jgi:hypothetical protein
MARHCIVGVRDNNVAELMAPESTTGVTYDAVSQLILVPAGLPAKTSRSCTSLSN